MPEHKARLVLEDGSSFEGFSFGAETTTYGEVVFNTSMTGYQEMLTDPSYSGQIVVPTYPIIGNYGINAYGTESRSIQVKGFVIRDECAMPSHSDSEGTVDTFLKSQKVPGLCGVDTRAITRRLRVSGVMMGVLTSQMSAPEALKFLKSQPRYDDIDFVKLVTTDKPFDWDNSDGKTKVVVMDFGTKYNILRILKSKGCAVRVVPATTSSADVLALKPDGVLLSPGPGDPALLENIRQNVLTVARAKPTLGICLGHQLIAWAFGGKTYKLKFGHRGGNHPVKDMTSGLVHITAQNHGYAVDADGLPSSLAVSHINLNDNTVEGMVHKTLPLMTIQYHAEASPGPRDNMYIFDKFLEMVKSGNGVK
ncbi:MAG: carbamoyl-phosphate synthase small subunit [Dehalococcoidia bacterium]|nr:carbamoyl-phosphate synthase small subunit [Dehalococcoidia bacterium]